MARFTTSQKDLLQSVAGWLSAKGPLNTHRLALCRGDRSPYETCLRDRLFRLAELGYLEAEDHGPRGRVWSLTTKVTQYHFLDTETIARLPGEWRAAIQANPADRTTWLVLADFLEERCGAGEDSEKYQDRLDARAAAQIRTRIDRLLPEVVVA